MQHLALPGAARITQRATVYKAFDPDSELALRVTEGRRPRLAHPDVCTWFVTRAQAEETIAELFGASTLEVMRCEP